MHIMFQFQYGAIKGTINQILKQEQLMFQFQYGAIKGWVGLRGS